jgi:hypothetical protein
MSSRPVTKASTCTGQQHGTMRTVIYAFMPQTAQPLRVTYILSILINYNFFLSLLVFHWLQVLLLVVSIIYAALCSFNIFSR